MKRSLFSFFSDVRWGVMFFMVVYVTICGWSSLYAHQSGQSYIFLRIFENAVSGRFEVTLSDLNKSMGFITPENQITPTNINDRVHEIHAYYQKKVRFLDEDIPLSLRFTGLAKRELDIGHFVLLEFSLIERGPIPETFTIDYEVLFDKDPNHLGLLVIEHFWNANLFNNEKHVSLVFSPSDHRQNLSLLGYSTFNGFLGVVKLGIKHIWKGIDHILFLVALILPAAMFRRENNWEPLTKFGPATIKVVKIVTLFTIAHSITLSIAALGVFDLPSRLVEPIIALSIAVAALDIIFPVFRQRIGWVVFIFGLFHGFGFASVLKEIGVLGEHLVLSLFGFNLGVEIGQVVIICAVFPMIYFFRRYAFYPNIIMRYGAATMMVLAVFWFVDRTFLSIDFSRMFKDSFFNVIKSSLFF